MRKLFLFIAALTLSAGMWAQEINAVKFVQGATTDWYLLSTNPEVTFTDHNPVIAGKSYDLTQGEVTTTFGTAPEDTWVTVRTDGVADNWNTICLERNITAIDGATFWTVSGQDANFFILDEVTEPQAGFGYLILFTAAELKVKYGSETAASPVTASYGNPIQGTFTLIDFDKTTGLNELVGNYVVYNNQLCKVEAWERLLAHRAYVVTNHVPDNAPAKDPDRARTSIPKQKEIPTELEMVDDAPTPRFTKYIKDGQLVIVRDNKMYNAQGMRL